MNSRREVQNEKGMSVPDRLRSPGNRELLLGNRELLLGDRRSEEADREGLALLYSVSIIKAGFYKAFKERMCIIGFGSELGMILHADAPGMIGPFDGFDQIAILGQTAD